MKSKVIYTILFIASAPLWAFLIASLTTMPLVKADGKTFYEIISSPELILRFISSSLIFGLSVYLLGRFILIRFYNYLFDNE